MELWAHQKECIEKYWSYPGFGLFFEMGTGKTLTAIKMLEKKMEEKKLRTLILCPPIVIQNWVNEFRKYSKSLVVSHHVVPLTGSGMVRRKTFKEKVIEGPGIIVVTNYESLLMQQVFLSLAAWKPQVLILDEAHKCKDIKAKRTQLATEIADKAEHKILLTGTPVLNSPMDLFSQFRILDKGETFGVNFYAFRARFFWDRNQHMPKLKYFPDWQVKPAALKKINELVSQKSMHVKKSDCLDLPPMVRQRYNVEMTIAQKVAYESMEKDFIAYLDQPDNACVAEMALTKALRLQQIVSGYAKLEDGEVMTFAECPRSKALYDLLEDLTPNHQVLVWAVFRENYNQIRMVCEELGIKYVEVHGEKTEAQKREAVELFNNFPEYRVYIGHPGSGGIGINLVTASYSIWFSRSFSLEQDLQAEARNYRGGSEIHEKITRIDLVTPDSIDEVVLDALEKKEAIGEQVLRRVGNYGVCSWTRRTQEYND